MPYARGPVPPGGSATRVFTVKNLDESETSWVAARVGFSGPGFSVSPEEVSLPPGESADVTVTFSPTEEGHRSAQFGIVANATNRNYLSFLSHGYGGGGVRVGEDVGQCPGHCGRAGVVAEEEEGEGFGDDVLVGETGVAEVGEDGEMGR